MLDLDELVDRLAGRCAASDAQDRRFIAEHAAIYRLLWAETPQWMETLHAAFRVRRIACTGAALGELKSVALRASGAGEAAWRRMHALGDRAFAQRRLGPTLHNLIVLLKLTATCPPAVLPDVRLVDALCNDADDEPRALPRMEELPPAGVIATMARVLQRTGADCSDPDIVLRTQLRQVLDWARHEVSAAGTLAVRCGWGRLVAQAREWQAENPGRGVPSALPLRIRCGHLEAVQLRTPVQLEREGLLMFNCLDEPEMAARLRRPESAFFSIRDRAGRRTVADLEIAYWPRSRCWAMEQLKAIGNQEPEPDVRAFARALCVTLSPRQQLMAPRALPQAADEWASAHPDPPAANLAARFGILVSRGRIEWIAPFITRRSRYHGALGVDTVGDDLLETWRREFCGRSARSDHRLRLLRLPTDGRRRPGCVFDDGQGLRAVTFRADADGRLAHAFEVFDHASIARWVEPDQGGDAAAMAGSASTGPPQTPSG